MAAPPELPVELVEEILVLLPPDEPAWLLRASLVCKAWGCAVSHSSFRRRLHEIHGTAPVLGFLHDWSDERIPNFVPTTASSFSLAAPDRRLWRALDCRHGRALFLSEGEGTKLLLLWEPITGAEQLVRVPVEFEILDADAMIYPSAAVFCAAAGCDHHGCHGGPFRVAFVFTVDTHTDYEEYVTSACVYSSETGTWGELVSKDFDFMLDFGEFPSVLVGRSLVYFMHNGMSILEYDFARNELAVIDKPDSDSIFRPRFILMLAEDGGLGLMQDMDSHLNLWSKEASDRTGEHWVRRVINLHNLLPIGALVNASRVYVLGFAEGANAIFVGTTVGLFTIELMSGRVRKVWGTNGFGQLIPIIGFYTPVSRNEHQDIPLSNVSEEERGEEKTVDQAQQLLDNGSKAIREGTLPTPSNVSAMSSDPDERVPPYEDIALECTDMDAALLYRTQEMTDPLGDVPKTAQTKKW